MGHIALSAPYTQNNGCIQSASDAAVFARFKEWLHSPGAADIVQEELCGNSVDGECKRKAL